MYRKLLLIVLLCTVSLLAGSCSGTGTADSASLKPAVSSSGNAVDFADLGLEFPPPSELAARIVSLDDDWLKPGADYEAELPYVNVTVEDTSLRYRVVSDTDPGQYRTALAFYAFNIVNQPVSTELKLIWHDYPGHLPCWVGLPVLASDEWDWIPLPANATIRLSDCSRYMTTEAPLTVGVVLSGRVDQVLDWVRLGDNTPPVAGLTATPDSGECPLTVILDASASTDSDGNIVRYDWDFDGDGITDSRSYTRSWTEHTYSTPGSYDATVTVYDDAGDSGSAQAAVTVAEAQNHAPVARISANPLSGVLPLEVTFDGSASSDDDGGIVRYDWDFDGDGTIDYSSETGERVKHTFEELLNATVLTVTDDEGASDSASLRILTEEWVHSWGTDSNDWFWDAVVDGDGAVYACGKTGPGQNTLDNSLLIKYSINGDLQWLKSWDAEYNASLTGLVVDSHGDIWGCGSQVIPGETAAYADILLQKYSPDGELLLNKTWGGWFEEHSYQMQIDADDNKYIAGISLSFEEKSTSIVLLKYDAAGELVWSKLWGENGDYESVHDSLIDAEGRITLCGYKSLAGQSYEHDRAVAMQVDGDGVISWCRSYMIEPDSTRAHGIALGPDGELAVVGTHFRMYGSSYYQAYMMLLDSVGNPLWTRTWDTPDFDCADACFFGEDGNLYVSGRTLWNDLRYITLSGAGDLEWILTMNRTNYGGFKLHGRPDQPLFLLGYNPDIETPSWKILNDGYTFDEATPVVASLDLQFRDVQGTEGVPEGVLTEPVGVEDTGGGEDDAYIMRLSGL